MIHFAPTTLAVFEFSSLPMLGWLAAVALPWLIHRLYRRQHRTTTWAAVELLLNAMQQRARRMQMQQWLLLAVRTAILVLVALAAAEPALRQLAIGAGSKASIHRILVIDQSYSMGCQQQQSSRWELALKHARQRIESSSGEALTIIGWDGQAENLTGKPTFDTSIAAAALDSLQLSNTSAELSSVARTVLAAIKRADSELPHLAAHQVVFCTDLGRQTWQRDEAGRKLLEDVASQAHVSVVNVASGPNDNLAITDLQIEPSITIQQREATITATVACFGQPTSNSVTVDFLVSGRRIEQQQVKLNPDGEATVRMTHRFVDQGPQTIQAVIANGNDCLSSDDSRWLVADVRPKLRVACFAGQPGSADDLVRALAPTGRLGESVGVISPELFSIHRLGELELDNYDAVMLCNVSRLSTRESAAVKKYVEQGGSLAVFLGQDSISSQNGLLSLLPIEIVGPQTAGPYSFDPLGYRHPIVEPFRGQTHAGLLGVTISQYQQLQIREESPGLEVVLAFNTNDPALVVGRHGLGRVAVSALPGSLAVRTAAGMPWSSFALSPSFLPVVRELVIYLVGDRWHEQRNLEVGAPAVFSFANGKQPVEVRLPAGSRNALPQLGGEDREQMTYSETNQPGVYRFSAGEQEFARFAVNLDGRDSDLRPVDEESLPDSITNAALADGGKVTQRTTDFSFVRTLLAAALVLLLLEIGLAWLLGRGWG